MCTHCSKLFYFFSLRFNIDDLVSVNQYAIHMKLKLCYTQGAACQKIIKFLDNARFPKVNCSSDQYAINGKNAYEYIYIVRFIHQEMVCYTSNLCSKLHQKQLSILDSLTIMELTCLILRLQICISVVYAREQFPYASRPLSLQFNVKN